MLVFTGVTFKHMKPRVTITQYSGVFRTAQPITVNFGSNRRDAAKYLRSLRQIQGLVPALRIRVTHYAEDAYFLAALESRSMSTWTDEELRRYSLITGQVTE
jgi:hypothetical protein